MPFVPHGKKSKRKWERERQVEGRERVLDAAVSGVRVAIGDPRLCLQTCVVLERLLRVALPRDRFDVRLGSLHVYPVVPDVEEITFDPRGPDGIDGGFHVWLEDQRGQVIDPTILLTLRAEGYEVDGATYLLHDERRFQLGALRFVYEELPALELVDVEKSEPAIAAHLILATTGVRPPVWPQMPVDIDWRAGHRPQPREPVTPEE